MHSPPSLIVYLYIISLLYYHKAESQRTILDTTFQKFYTSVRLWLVNNIIKPLDIEKQWLEQKGKVESAKTNGRSSMQMCDTRQGPGRRSSKPPNSVHRLRPGDIDIVAALGDSITAGNGIMATNLLQLINENRGLTWSIGGQGDWRQFLTLPNILKEFNPNLYGYSLGDSFSTNRKSKFNVAELSAMSRDMPYMAKVLVKRLTHDPLVNMTHHWKLITLFIGSNDFCSNVCYLPQPMKAVDDHEQNMLKTYRYLRDNVPRLMINVIPAPNLLMLTKLNHLPALCFFTLRVECPCIIGKSKEHLKFMGQLMDEWFERDIEIAKRKEFNTETFTINIQPFTKDFVFPTFNNGSTDISYSSEDCFHFSQKGQALCANMYWNNMLEMPWEKSIFSPKWYGTLKCPTKERPYLITRTNCQSNFKI